SRIRIDNDASAGQALADVVIGGALQLEGHATREERAEALAGCPLESDMNRVVGETGMAVAGCDDAGQHRAHRTVRIADPIAEPQRLPAVECRGGSGDQLVIERAAEPMVLLLAAVARHLGRHRGLMEDAREIESPGLPVLDA